MSQSSQIPLFVRDMFIDIATKTNAKLVLDGFAHGPVYFDDGHPLEIVNRLQEKLKIDAEREKRFPLIMLFHDIKQTRNSNVFYGDIAPNLAFASLTSPNYSTAERYANNFEPILSPIYWEFFRQLGKSGYFHNALAQVNHDRIDRVFWGKTGLYGNTGNQFNDYLDCIEVSIPKLTVKQQFCKPFKS